MKVLIIGAHGKIGKLTTEKMKASAQFSPTAFIRKEEQRAFFEAMDVPVCVASLESSVDEIAQTIKGFDAVVFTAGSGGKTGFDKTLEIDLDGAVKSMLAAEQAGVKRYVMVSACFADDRSKWEASGIKPYYIAKHFADRELQRTNLDYTILRPVRLTDEAGSETVTIKPTPEGVQSEISREDVATSILEVLNHPETIGKIMVMSAGVTPVKEAVLSVWS
ncbi:NAD(P)H-binding protein [Maribellus comscasis]|uniref:NAD(P)H-binding protein n=1 Tax=Maribellus comscasis TaxID=2681766 RepID=A0A6I6JJP1_9BACT|nr:SDR family oxidoreductase [Maribellus comscasis]QGY42491.1 NAD(P)H-binding protein [Maribellus comscasis]